MSSPRKLERSSWQNCLIITSCEIYQISSRYGGKTYTRSICKETKIFMWQFSSSFFFVHILRGWRTFSHAFSDLNLPVKIVNFHQHCRKIWFSYWSTKNLGLEFPISDRSTALCQSNTSRWHPVKHVIMTPLPLPSPTSTPCVHTKGSTPPSLFLLATIELWSCHVKKLSSVDCLPSDLPVFVVFFNPSKLLLIFIHNIEPLDTHILDWVKTRITCKENARKLLQSLYFSIKKYDF